VLNKIAEEDAALAQGRAKTARIVSSDGSEVFSCDVGDVDSDAVVKLGSTQIGLGTPGSTRSGLRCHKTKSARDVRARREQWAIGFLTIPPGPVDGNRAIVFPQRKAPAAWTRAQRLPEEVENRASLRAARRSAKEPSHV
jgi:hypothetical protein